MNPSVEALENQYFLLRTNLSALLAKCGNQTQKDQILTAVAKARDNYWIATRRILHDDDPAVKKLVSQMNSAQLLLTPTVEHLDEIVKVIDAITQAVAIGSLLAAQAVPI